MKVLKFAAVLLFAAWIPSIMAQSAGTGALAGAVTDPSGATIPNVAVTVTNTETNQARTATTGADGSYKFTLLSPGTYRVRFSAAGFKTAEVPAVVVNVTETPVLDRALEVGAQTEQVTVEATTETVQTASSTLGTVVGSRAVTSLPLTTRNYTQILGLSAGVSGSVNNAATFGKGTSDMAVNGANVNQNNYQMDGVNVDNFAGNNLSQDAGIYAGIGIPNPDALQEFKIQTSTYDASYGRNPGANVNVVTRSGTNSLHGSLFEFFRNRALNANDFFRNRYCGQSAFNAQVCAGQGGVKQVLNQNQFGGSVGMPFKKDKIFFFFSYQETRQINGVGYQGYASNITLPSIPGGDRSTPAFRQALGALYSNATPVAAGSMKVAPDGSNINPVALNILNLKLPNGQYYVPGSGTAGNLASPLEQPSHFTEHQAVANLDYIINSRHSLGLRFYTGQDPQTINFTRTQGDMLPGTPASGLYANTNAIVKLTSILTPSFLNEGRLSFQRNLAAFSDGVPFTMNQIGSTPINPAIPVMSSITIAGLFNMGGGISDDVFDPTNQYQVADTISWNHGRHTVRAGVEYERIDWPIVFKGIERGQITINSFPDFLIGRAGCNPGDANCSTANPGVTNGGTASNLGLCLFCVRSGPSGIIHGYESRNISWFVQDDWKATSRLTLNLGLRWEYDGTLEDKYGNLTNVWESQLRTVNSGPGILGTGINGGLPTSGGTFAGYVVPSNFLEHYPQPPAGILVNSRTLPVASGPPMNNFGPRFGFAWQPTGSSRFAIRGGLGLFYDRIGGNQFVHSVEQGNPYADTLDYNGSGALPFSLQSPFPQRPLGFIPRWVNPLTNATSNLNVPYINERIHTPLTRQFNVNMQWEFLPRWVLEVGYVGSNAINQTDYNHNVNTALLASASAPSNFGITTNTVQNVAFRVPYLGFQPAGLQVTGFDGIAKYNSLQATVRKNLSHGITLQAAYTWSKTLTDLEGWAANWNNNSNLRQQYGEAYFNRPQRFVINYTWDLPFGNHSGVLGAITKGWSVSGVTTVQAGQPLTFTDARGGTIYGVFGPNSINPTNFGGATFGANNYSRSQLCPGVTYGQIASSGHVEQRLGGPSGGSGFWNLNAFSNSLPTSACGLPVIGNGTDYGNSGVGIARGPGQMNWDLSVIKSTRVGGIREGGTLIFRAEFFNAFNHPQFNNPGTATSTPATFGIITSTSVAPRLIQFALKYVF
jgi:hypothetical protein